MPARDGPLQRIGVLAELPALLSELGVDPVAVFGPFGIDVAMLSHDTRMPFVRSTAIMERAAQTTNRPEIGLLLGSRADHRSLGIVGELVDCAVTVGRALDEYVAVQGGLSQAASAYVLSLGDVAALGYGVYDRYAPGTEHFYAIATAVTVNALRRLSAGQADVIEVHFSHRAPADPRTYERLLRARVCFNCEQTAVLFPKTVFHLPNPHADRERHSRLAEVVASSLRLKAGGTTQRLRHQMRPALSRGDATLEGLARRLGLSVRSLNRRLAEEDTSFSAQRDSVRHVMACELLALTNLSVGDISLALSYANHSAFVRSFRRWSDTSPTEWRNAHVPQRAYA